MLTYKQTVDMIRDKGYRYHELRSNHKRIAIVPKLGDRIVAVCARSVDEPNPFYISPESLDESHKLFGLFGKRTWTGPRGAGNISLFLDKKNGEYIPEAINIPDLSKSSEDSEPFLDVCKGTMNIDNARGSTFKIGVRSETSIMPDNFFKQARGYEDIEIVAIQRNVKYKNLENHEWGHLHGNIFIWDISMLVSDDETEVILPFKGREGTSNDCYIDYYDFGDYKGVPKEKRASLEDVEVLRADGQDKWKLGLSAHYSKGFVISYIPIINTLAVLIYYPVIQGYYMSNKPTDTPELQGGPVLEVFNNGSDENGRFHQLEVHSPNLTLRPKDVAYLNTKMIFLKGEKGSLEEIARELTENNQIRF